MRTANLLSLAFVTGLACTAASGQYLVDPSGGTTLFSTNDDDATANGRSLGFTGHFFGQDVTTVDVSTNGNLNFSGDGDYSNAPFPGGAARIAPMWDDLYVYGGQNVRESVNPGVWYAVTWELSTFSYGHVYRPMQVVWFGAQTTIAGVTFLPDDIAFCYAGIGANNVGWDVTTGLNKGDGSTFVTFAGEGDGFMNEVEATNELPVYPTSGGFILYRRVGDSYSGTVMAAPNFCPADFNRDQFLDFFDIDAYIAAFEAGC